MDLRSDKRQNIQKKLDFPSERKGEARQAGREETESRQAMHEPENPANTIQLREEVCKRENLKEALRRGEGKKGRAGVDGVDGGPPSGHLKEDRLTNPGQKLNGTHQPQPGRRVGVGKTGGGGVRKVGVPTHLG